VTKRQQILLNGGFLLLWFVLVFLAGAPRGDFANYWTASSLWWEGADLSRVYDYRWFTAQSSRLGFSDQLVGFAVLPPPSVLFAVPLLFAGPVHGATIWWVVQGLFGVLLAGLLARSTQKPTWLGLAGLCLFYPSLQAHLYQGQFHLVAVVALAAGFVGWRENRPVLCGVCWGFAIGLKIFAWPLLVLSLLARQWRQTLAMVTTLAGGGVASVLLLGTPIHTVWLAEVAPAAAGGWFGDPWHLGYQSLGHALRVALVDQPGGHQAFHHLPVVAAGLTLSATVAVVSTTVLAGLRWEKLKLPERTQLLAAASICGLVVGAALSQYHLIWLMPAVALVLNKLHGEQNRSKFFMVFGLTLAILWVPLPTEPPESWHLLWPFLVVPRFWLLLLLWGVMVPWGAARSWKWLGVLLSVVAGFQATVSPNEVGVHPLEDVNGPLISADLVRVENGAVCWSGLRADRAGKPGRGWMGFCLNPDEHTATLEAWNAGSHVWSPSTNPQGGVAWSTASVEIEVRPRTGPDGGTLFSKEEDGQFDIYWVGPLGTQLRLTNHPAMDVEPVWDPARRRVWFLSDRHAGVRALRVWWIPWPSSSASFE